MCRLSSCIATLVVLAAAVLLDVAAPAGAQAASSPTYLLVASEVAPGGRCVSTGFRLDLALGAGGVAPPASSANFRLPGGFNAALDVTTTGSPWLTGVSPPYAPILGGTVHSLHGAELDLGAATNVTVGGAAATVTARFKDRITITMPLQQTPGWQPVVATNSGGTATLARGIGVLPLVEMPRPFVANEPFRITYRGTPGDVVYVVVTGARLPFAVTIPPYNHGLELNLGTLLGLVGPLPVFDPSGLAHLDFPGLNPGAPVYVQMFGLPAANPGYAPGTFTNVIKL